MVDNSMMLYSDGLATTNPTAYGLQCQFNRTAGYSTTTSITNANQFASKAYVDAQVTGAQSLDQINDSNPLTANLDFSASAFKVRGTTPVTSTDFATKGYVDAQTGTDLTDLTARVAQLESDMLSEIEARKILGRFITRYLLNPIGWRQRYGITLGAGYGSHSFTTSPTTVTSLFGL